MPITAALSKRTARVARKVVDRGLRLGPPLSEKADRAFEARHRVSLPDAYRSFLLHAGPPEYGLVAMRDGEREARIQ
jgi:hypothetical protein